MIVDDLFGTPQHVYEPPGGVNIAIHLHGLIKRPATPIISLPLTRAEFNAILRAGRWRYITRSHNAE